MKSIKELFLMEVLRNIKSREAQEYIEKELNYHLNRSKSELISKGLSQDTAEEQAVKQMGNPSELGQQLNKLHRPKVDWMLLVLLLAALWMGLLPLLSIQGDYDFKLNIVTKQAIYILIGMATALIVMFLDYRKLKKWGWYFLVAGMLFLFALFFIPNVVMNGAPYISILGFTFSPITALPCLFLFWASFLSKRKPKLWLIALIYTITTFLFISLLALPVAMIYSIFLFVLFCGSTIKRKTIYITTLGIGIIGVIFSFLSWTISKPYQKERLLSFLNPEADPNGSGYMYLKVEELMTGGGWFGGEKSALYIPEMSTDFAFASVTYSYGWIIAALLALVLTLIAVRMLFITDKMQDPFGKQLVIGTIALFSIQFLYHIGMSLGFLPITSMSLPFISYGLTPTILNSFLIGIVLSVYRRKDLISEVDVDSRSV